MQQDPDIEAGYEGLNLDILFFWLISTSTLKLEYLVCKSPNRLGSVLLTVFFLEDSSLNLRLHLGVELFQ